MVVGGIFDTAVLYLHGTHGEHTYPPYFCRAQKHDDICTHSAKPNVYVVKFFSKNY